MNTEKFKSDRFDYTCNDELFPTEITFSGGFRVRLGCSEDGQAYLKVEPE
ncbi:hypothetical protein Geob_2431 [Geotalea daltonii FRC-32]|uniref:Uncharacterized protein n=1 Tax=Geotalea daltonii (strain DSM 22248 / JCM 15807 / FRC-32) TaxID=316067 RepID=B9M004_GEODF|nr:hypothetical protein [Geotalea daltonii]ACM20784.1 hypothetical protein Geob_2431 [Geotalea daltonii FRC-32]